MKLEKHIARLKNNCKKKRANIYINRGIFHISSWNRKYKGRFENLEDAKNFVNKLPKHIS